MLKPQMQVRYSFYRDKDDGLVKGLAQFDSNIPISFMWLCDMHVIVL